MQSEQRRIDPAGVAVGALLFVLAGVLIFDMTTLTITQTYGVGPKAMLAVVATGLVLLAIGNAILALRGDFPERERPARLPILLILGGLVAVIVLIGIGGGFIPAVTILFAATSAAFGRRALSEILTDLAIGAGVGIAAYLIFARLLSLSLPMGPIERLF